MLTPTVIVSDNTKHTKHEIASYLYKILTKLPPSVKILKIWSDGPTSQFKNKYTVALIKLLENRFKIKVYWNFFATSHGKGCVDGIGAAVKNRVRRLVKSRQAIANCSLDFVAAFNSETSLIDVIDMPPDESEKIEADLQFNDAFASAAPVPGILNFHQIQICNGQVVGNFTSKEGYP